MTTKHSLVDDLTFQIMDIVCPEGYDPEELETMRFVVANSGLEKNRKELIETCRALLICNPEHWQDSATVAAANRACAALAKAEPKAAP
jgi:hypothetical protein